MSLSFVSVEKRSSSASGVALLDFDRDGALDIFVTNGPGAANSLYRNLIEESGRLEFEDVAVQAGVGAEEMDATGVCFGDIDNDGDEDLYVLGRNEPNRLYANDGDGTFSELTDATVRGGTFNHTGCSLGDIDGDGLLDIVVANSFDWSNQLPIILEPFALNQPSTVASIAASTTCSRTTAPGASAIRWSRQAWIEPARGWAWHSATSTATARWISSRPTSATTASRCCPSPTRSATSRRAGSSGDPTAASAIRASARSWRRRSGGAPRRSTTTTMETRISCTSVTSTSGYWSSPTTPGCCCATTATRTSTSTRRRSPAPTTTASRSSARRPATSTTTASTTS